MATFHGLESSRSPSRPARRARAAWLIGALAVVVVGAAPSAPRAGAAPLPAVQSLVAQVSQAQYEQYHTAIESMGLGLYGGPAYNQGYRGRDGWQGSGSLGNQEARLYLSDTLASMGLSTSLQGTYSNVVAELPGATTPQTIYIIGAHYDHISGDRPGGDDNASGVAALLEAARVLSQYRFESTIRFVAFNAEEDGLLGSNDYVQQVVKGGGPTVVEQIAGMLSLDMLLMPSWYEPQYDTKDQGRIDLDLGTRPITACRQWAQAFIASAADYVPGIVVESYETTWGGSDHVPLANEGLPAILVIENTASEIWGGHANPFYHTSNDARNRAAGAYYDFAFATDVTRAVVALMAVEAVLVPEPSSWALLAAALLVVAPIAARRRHRARSRAARSAARPSGPPRLTSSLASR